MNQTGLRGKYKKKLKILYNLKNNKNLKKKKVLYMFGIQIPVLLHIHEGVSD